MTDVNAPIQYNWRLGWNGVSEPYPVVTPLLKAILEKDMNKVNELEKQEASLKACDKTTFGRIVFHVADNYPVMEWLVNHGMSRIAKDIDVNGNNGINEEKCISPHGYQWGLPARAYYLKAYDVMDLLCAHGFSDFCCYDEGWEDTWYADNYIFNIGDERAINILLSNGYIFGSNVKGCQYYEKYVLNRNQVKRKSIGLDNCKWGDGIPRPKYEDVPLIFGKKEVIARNNRRREDYEDRVRAYNEFVSAFGRNSLDEYLNKKNKFDKEFSDLMGEMLRSGEI